jgi:hypothetical protein
MIPNHLLFSALCLATLISPQALKSQTHLTIESLVLNTYAQTADFTFMLQSKDLDWKVADNGRSKADLILITTSLDKRGDVLVYEREYRAITADTEDAVKLARTSTPLSARIKIPAKTYKVRFLIQSVDQREIDEFEVDRKTIYAAAAPELPALPCRTHGLCYP